MIKNPETKNVAAASASSLAMTEKEPEPKFPRFPEIFSTFI